METCRRVETGGPIRQSVRCRGLIAKQRLRAQNLPKQLPFSPHCNLHRLLSAHTRHLLSRPPATPHFLRAIHPRLPAPAHVACLATSLSSATFRRPKSFATVPRV